MSQGPALGRDRTAGPARAATGGSHAPGAEAEPTGSSWRDVSPDTYRRATFLSSIAGVALMAIGMWDLAHAHLVRGVVLVGIGFVIGVWTAMLRIDGMPAPLYRPQASRAHAAAPHQRDAGTSAETWSPQVLHFYTRENCSICHEARVRIDHDLGDAPVTVIDHDVDQDGALTKMYGDRVPVAVFDGKEVFALRYDSAAVRAVAAAAHGDGTPV